MCWEGKESNFGKKGRAKDVIGVVGKRGDEGDDKVDRMNEGEG